MSRIYVDRISPYQSGSVQVDGLNLDTGSLATKVELNSYTASNDSKVNSLISATSSYQPAGDYATTGSNTFNGTQTLNVGDGVFGLKVNFNNSSFYSIGSQNVVGVLKNDFSEATTVGLGTGFETYNASGDVGLTPNLNGVTSEGDDRPGLFAYSGSVARDVIALPKTSWDNNGQIAFKTPVSINDSTNIEGQLSVFNTLFVSQSGVPHEISGDNITVNVSSGLQKFQINNGGHRFYTIGDTWGNITQPFTQGITMGQQYGLNVFNSAFTIDHGFALNMNSAAGTGTNKVGIWGVGSGGYYDFISFEDATNWTDGRIEVHRTLQVDEVLQLQPQDPLPTGAVGQLAVSGSDLYFHNGTNWILK